LNDVQTISRSKLNKPCQNLAIDPMIWWGRWDVNPPVSGYTKVRLKRRNLDPLYVGL